jgi:phosphate transport system permease protein
MGSPETSQSRRKRKEPLAAFFLRGRRRGDKVFRWIVFAAAGYSLLMLALVVLSIGEGSLDVFAKEGLAFFVTTDWNPVEGRESYGALPYIVGTLGVPVSLGIAVFVSEIAPPKVGTPIGYVVEVLAAIPSIVYGLWGLFVFRFWVLDLIERPMQRAFDWPTPFGLDILTAGIVLSIMIIPIISSISREILKAVPNTQREAAYGLGATRFETVRKFVFPYAKAGLLGAAILGLGRAVGETIAVTMLIGNAVGIAAIPDGIYAPSQTLSSVIANEFNEAVTQFHISALIGLAAVLFVITMAINVGAQLLVRRMAKVAPGVKE